MYLIHENTRKYIHEIIIHDTYTKSINFLLIHENTNTRRFNTYTRVHDYTNYSPPANSGTYLFKIMYYRFLVLDINVDEGEMSEMISNLTSISNLYIFL